MLSVLFRESWRLEETREAGIIWGSLSPVRSEGSVSKGREYRLL